MPRPAPLVVLALALALPLASGAARGQAADPPRVVEFTPDTKGREINRYYSLEAHGPTVKFYAFPQQAVVVVVRLTPAAEAIETVVDVNVFPTGTTVEGLEKWINNQHSDGIFPDPAEPVRQFRVDPARVRATRTGPLDHEVGGNGDEYDRYRVEFTIDAFTDGDVEFRASRGAADAFVRTKDVAVAEPIPGRGP